MPDDGALEEAARERHTRLRSIAARLGSYAAHLERIRDSRSVFATTYMRLTEALESRLDDLAFEDPEWVVALAECFSSLFFDAVDQFDAGNERDDAWTTLQNTLLHERSSVLQDLLTCLGAHIIHDLPLAVIAVGSTTHGTSRVADYHLANDVIGDSIEATAAEIELRYNRWLRWLDQIADEDLQWLSNYGIRLGRAAAWYNAERLRDPEHAAAARIALEQSPVIFLNRLFHPAQPIVRLLLRAAQMLVSLGRTWPEPVLLELPRSVYVRDNQTYYLRIGVGRWRGKLRYRISSWRAFVRARMSLRNRSFAVLTAAVGSLGGFRIDSEVHGAIDQGPAGVATNRIAVSFLGLTMYRVRERYSLSPNGTDVHVRAVERYGFFPLSFRGYKSHPGRIIAGGTRAHYEFRALDSEWAGDYVVGENGDSIEAELRTSWGMLHESIHRAH